MENETPDTTFSVIEKRKQKQNLVNGSGILLCICRINLDKKYKC